MIPISMRMKRAVLCVLDPQNYIDQLDDYSIMIVNPAASDLRKQYLLAHADWSLKIDAKGFHHRAGGDYGKERLLWYTSGTTGDSKFCSFDQAQLDHMASRICKDYEITANDRYVGIMPLWHAHGQGFYWATKMAQCQTNFISIAEIRTMPTYHPTFVTAVPDVLKLIAQLDVKNLRFVRGASATLEEHLYLSLKQKFACPVIEAFGMTEALSHCFTNPLHGEQRIGTIGLPSGVEARIVDEELFIRGFTVCNSEWYGTGDHADQDEKGYYRILGRVRDQINVKGYKLNPVSIEHQLLKKCPGLESCVIFGRDHVMCIYTGHVPKNQVFEALISIHSACRPWLLEQAECIPVSDSGKISRTWLLKNYQ